MEVPGEARTEKTILQPEQKIVDAEGPIAVDQSSANFEQSIGPQSPAKSAAAANGLISRNNLEPAPIEEPRE